MRYVRRPRLSTSRELGSFAVPSFPDYLTKTIRRYRENNVCVCVDYAVRRPNGCILRMTLARDQLPLRSRGGGVRGGDGSVWKLPSPAGVYDEK